LSIAIAELANISERRIERLVNPSLSNGLPAFLTEFGGLNSGLMIPQYTAAALVSENKSLAHPASVDSIPTSANQEDHVSMGTISVRKARQILNNSRKVLSIELLCAAQAIDLRIKKEALDHKTQLSPSPVIAKIIHMLRQSIAHLSEDRYLYPDMTKAEEILKSGELLNLAEETIGKLL
jgi:histidine ammonia-lyase